MNICGSGFYFLVKEVNRNPKLIKAINTPIKANKILNTKSSEKGV
jgi:hypothetical protein